MTIDVPVEKLFNFLSLRPPTPATDIHLTESFIPYVPSDGDGSLIERVIQLAWPAARDLAAAYIDDAPSVLEFQVLPRSAGFVALRSAITARPLARATRGEIEEILGGPVHAAVSQKSFPVARGALRDVYAAHCILLRQRPEQRETALQSLRTLHLLQHVDRDPGVLDDPRRLARIVRARAILPAPFLQKKADVAPGARPSSGTTPGQPAPATSTPHLTPATLERLRELHGIRRELTAALRRNRSALTLPREAVRSRPRPPAPVSDHDAARPGDPEPGEPMRSGLRSAASSRVLPAAAVQSLSQPACDLLAAAGLPTDHLRVDDGFRAVDAQIRRLRTLVLDGASTATAVAVDRIAASREAAGDILDDLLDQPTLPDVESPTVPGPFGPTPSGGVGPVQPLGIGQLLVVEQTLQRYQAVEISHVENVLQTESLKRSFRTLNRTEETVFAATATTEQNERDLQSADRYELSTQAQETIAQDMSTQAGMTVSASYGPVSVGAYGDFASTTSTSESTTSAVTFAQDVTERAVSTITTEVRQEQTTRIFQEAEEITEHGFDNTDGTGNVAGIYQWLEKQYTAQIYDYGIRLMFEFLIPEPAAYYRHALANRPVTGVTLPEPEPLGGLQPFDLTANNYQDYLSRYAVTGVGAPPPETTIVAAVFEQSGLQNNALVTKTQTLTVPTGYRAAYGRFSDFHAWFNDGHYLVVLIGNQELDSNSDENSEVAMDGEDIAIPVAVIGYLWGMAVTVEVECERTEAAYQDWQQETYDAIVAAYTAQKAAHDAQVSAAGVTGAPVVYGASEAENRRIEQEELKKGSLTMLARQYFEGFDAMHLSSTGTSPPEFDVDEAQEEGSYAQFMEQAFEWPQVTYRFYPYFWMNKSQWQERSLLQSSDALFGEFLRAGYARVVVPVTPAYDDAVLFFLNSGGRIWNGGDAPTIDDPLYVALVDELADPTEGRMPYGEPWTLTVPTTLVYLKADAALPDWTAQDA